MIGNITENTEYHSFLKKDLVDILKIILINQKIINI